MVRRCRSGMRPDQPIPPFDPTPVTVTKPCSQIHGLTRDRRFESRLLQRRVYEHRFEQSPYGRVAIDWHLDGDLPKVRTATPVGTTAELSLPDGSVMELARISHSAADFRQSAREATDKHMKKVLVVG